VQVPDATGKPANVTLGFDNLPDYVERSPYFGCITGRYANRIAGGRFTLGGRTFHVPVNEPPNSLHGGHGGFHTKLWDAHVLPATQEEVGVALAYASLDGDEGYPADLDVRVTYVLTAENDLRISYSARNESSDLATVVNLTNHAYWNLGGEGAGSALDHVVQIAASRYTPIDATLIPTGEVASVADTPFDFRAGAPLGERIDAAHEQLRYGSGYDHNFVLDRAPGDASLLLAARVHEPVSGRTLEVLTTEPAIQLYSGNLLDGTLVGPSGRLYARRDALALETQHYPDSPNQPSFPSTVLEPGEDLRSTTVYRFSTGPSAATH
jgi:aldose 1-epimerase